MTVQEAANVLSASPATVYDLIRDGVLAAYKEPFPSNPRTRRWNIDPKSVQDYMERGGPTPLPRPVSYVLPDIHDAMRSGDLKSLAPEDVRDWIQRLRDAALRAST